MSTKIRAYHATDAISLADLYVRSALQIGGRDYTGRQVEAWASLGPSPARIHELSTDGRIRLVAVDGSDQPIAFADLEQDGHIDLLYCSPKAAGQGVVSELYDELEKSARARGVRRLYAEASEAARRFLLKKGFAVTSKRELQISGVPIHNYAVEKALANE